MQRMSYIYFLYFYNQQSMQNQNYLSVPISQEFQPIEVELQNSKQSKEIDFKLFVLLILIVFLGLLINKHQQQLERQCQSIIKLSTPQYIPQLNVDNTPLQRESQREQEMEENQQSLSSRKQLYSLHKALLYTQTNLSIEKDIQSSQKEQQAQQEQHKPIKENPSVEIYAQRTQKPTKNLVIQKQPSQVNEKTKAKNHRNLMKKYVEFYFWFPFFIFALIIYSCYQKQCAQSSIFISVKKINELQQTGSVQECAICITEMKNGDLLAALPCSDKHVFHSGCIKEWLELKKTCPICRCDVRESRKCSSSK